MALTAENVRVAVTGAIYGAPSGTTLPTAVDTEPDGAFEELGYVSEDGVTQAIGSERNEIKAWQNGDVVRKVQTSHDVTYQLAFLETTPAVLEAYYGNYDDSGGAGEAVVELRGDSGTRQAWILNVLDGDNKQRVVIPDGEVTDQGDVVYVNGEAIQYDVTITAYPDENGVKAYLYFETAGAS